MSASDWLKLLTRKRPTAQNNDLSQPQSSLPRETPINPTNVSHHATDMLTDPFVERRLSRHKLEADAVVDHGEPPAGEVDASLE